MRVRRAALAAIFGLVLSPAAEAQQRTVLQQFDVPGSNYVTVVAETELSPNELAARHYHPGVEMTYVLEGEGDMSVEGQPTRHVKPGDHWEVPAATPHFMKNGPKPMKLLVTYVVEKGKPLAIPAPLPN
jgi:quercetin dioxygenase-like cupin family protein